MDGYYVLDNEIGMIQDGTCYIYRNGAWHEASFDPVTGIVEADALNALGIVKEDVPLAWYDWIFSRQKEWLMTHYGMFDAEGNWCGLPAYAPERIRYIYSHVRRIIAEAERRGVDLD